MAACHTVKKSQIAAIKLNVSLAAELNTCTKLFNSVAEERG